MSFMSKFDFRKISTLLILNFLTGISFLSSLNIFTTNLNWKCIEQKNNFETILGIIFGNLKVF